MKEHQETSWSQMTSQFLQTWTDTGNQMWKNWFDLMNAVPIPEVVGGNPDLKEASQRFLGNRETMVKFLQLSVDAWRDIFPKVETGEDWQQSLNKYTELMRNQLASLSTSSLKISQNSTQLWQLYLKEMNQYNQMWLQPVGLSLEAMTKALTGNSAGWIDLHNLYWNLLYEQTFGNLIQSPLLGPTRELNRKLLDGFDAWKNLYHAMVDYQVILSDIQVRSFEQLMRELVSLAEQGKKVEDWKSFQLIWSQVVDDIFEKTFCQEDNLKVRGKFLNALHTYRLKQQDIMEVSMKMMNLPLRSEIDEMHKTIYELRKEVKSLKKRLEESETLPVTPTPKSSSSAKPSA